MSDAAVRYAQVEQTCVIRFEGEIRYTMGHSLANFLDSLYERGGFRDVILDFTDARSIDSTGLGLLAKIAKLQRSHGGSKPMLVSHNADINALLYNMCLDEVLVISDQPPCADVNAQVPINEAGERDTALAVLNAHCLLCELNERNREMFTGVVESLSADLAKP